MIKESKQLAQEAKNKLNVVIIKETKRPNGSVRIQQDFSNCPTLAEQHTAHLSDLNYLISKYKPDELAAYMAARSQFRKEIIGHDFANEPTLQEAKNILLRSKQEFDGLSDDIRSQFKNHLEFIKFLDNPANAERMKKLGILTSEQIKKLQIQKEPVSGDAEPELKHTTRTRTKNEDKDKADV